MMQLQRRYVLKSALEISHCLENVISRQPIRGRSSGRGGEGQDVIGKQSRGGEEGQDIEKQRKGARQPFLEC